MYRENNKKYQRDFDHVDYLGVAADSSPSKTNDSTMKCGLSCPGVIWAMLSPLTMLSSLVAFIMPYWLMGELSSDEFSTNTTETYFGLWRRCNYYTLSSSDNGISLLQGCGRYTTFMDIPSIWWQICTLSMCAGCILSVFIGFFSIMTCCLDQVMSKTIAQSVGVFQFLAGLFLATACVLFPFGWEKNPHILQACGMEASVYNAGDCVISWGYYLAVASAGCTFIAAIFGCHAAKSKTRLRYDRVGL